jgi:twitching motility protein PilT
MVSIEELVQQLVERGGSDLHVSAGAPPMIRVDGRLISTELEVLDAEMTQKLIYSILDNEQILRFEKTWELDMSFGIAGLGRFRTNVFYQRGALGAVLRVIPFEVKSMSDLELPVDVCEKICGLRKGLIFVTGATGSGKSTTLAAMIDYINRSRNDHIMVIEDPIEFVHRNKSCLVNQREVGSDTRGFGEALRTVLRQDPDVIMIGELRDQETVAAALTIAETGHLTFATLHTNSVVQTVNRVIDVFPAYQQAQIRTQLSFSLEAVFCQQLVPRIDGRGRVLAAEVMIGTQAIRALIREDKAHQLASIIQTGGRYGMKTMNQTLYDLYRGNKISFDNAISHSQEPDELRRLCQKQGGAYQASTGGRRS